MMDFTKIFLSSDEIDEFRRAAFDKPIDYETALHLESVGLLMIVGVKKKGTVVYCELTASGERFFDYLERQTAKDRWSRGFNVITILIAIASLIVAIVALNRP